MIGFGKLVEDPWYDEDGVLIDEDSDEGDWEDDIIPPHTDIYSPHNTVNS